ncbi:hypothetical protein KQI65_06520 [bacterium]|nr:hypothetical protein [bacterium]
MRLSLRTCLAVMLISGLLLPALPQQGFADGPDRQPSRSWLRDGGDVLRPERTQPSDYVWYIGVDAGLTYSRFQDGPVYYIIPHPYVPELDWFGSADEGDGLGLYLGATVDFPLSDIFGIVIKGYYHTRTGTSETDLEIQHPTEPLQTAILHNETDMSFDYLSADILARINIPTTPVYALLGFAYSSLSSNNFTLNQSIVDPADLYYWEDMNGSIPNMLREGSTEGEIQQFKDSRLDFKLGLGLWIPLTPSLSLTPEAAVAIPMGDLIDSDQVDQAAIDAGFVNPDFNMITSFITIGLRWHID